jgi:hypothetical protein
VKSNVIEFFAVAFVNLSGLLGFASSFVSSFTTFDLFWSVLIGGLFCVVTIRVLGHLAIVPR